MQRAARDTSPPGSGNSHSPTREPTIQESVPWPRGGPYREARSVSSPKGGEVHRKTTLGAQAPRFPYKARPLTAGPRSRVHASPPCNTPQRIDWSVMRPASAIHRSQASPQGRFFGSSDEESPQSAGAQRASPQQRSKPAAPRIYCDSSEGHPISPFGWADSDVFVQGEAAGRAGLHPRQDGQKDRRGSIVRRPASAIVRAITPETPRGAEAASVPLAENLHLRAEEEVDGLASHNHSGQFARAGSDGWHISALPPPQHGNKSPPRMRQSVSRPLSASATGGRRNSTGYPVGTFPGNTKVTTLDRVRTENGWLREQLEGLRQELAVEIQINQYRAREKSQIEARLAASEAEIADAQKIAVNNLSVAKRREGLVHKVQDEGIRRKRLVQRLVLRLFDRDLGGAKGYAIADWTLFMAGIGHYFSQWRQLASLPNNAQEGQGRLESKSPEMEEIESDKDLASGEEGVGSSQRRPDTQASIERRLRRLSQQEKFLLRRLARSPEGKGRVERGGPRSNHVSPIAVHRFRGASEPAAPAEEASSAEMDIARKVLVETTTASAMRKEIRKAILGREEAREKLTASELHFLNVATDEICKRKRLQQLLEEERAKHIQQYNTLLHHITAARELANDLSI